MFGAYRYLLALLAIFAHLHPMYFGRLNWTGTYALFGFYVLSGYLMTRVLHEAYGFSREGVGRFLWNRALRIYPAYWCAAIVSLLVVMTVPETVHFYTKLVAEPTTPRAIAHNVFVFGMHASYGPRLVTPAWSLHVELCFYVLMAVVLARSRWTVLVWLVASLAYTSYTVYAAFPFGDRYGTIAAASLPFSMGSAIYFVARPGLAPRRFALPAVLVFLGGNLSAAWLVPDVMLHGFYAALAVTGATVFCLAHVSTRSLPSPLVTLDRWLGDLTYPMFLLHLPVVYLVIAWLFPGTRPEGTTLLLIGLPAVHLFALLVVVLVDHQIQPSRQKIRARGVEPRGPVFQPALARTLVGDSAFGFSNSLITERAVARQSRDLPAPQAAVRAA